MTYAIADLHCDTLSCRIAASEGKIDLRKSIGGHIDLERLKRGEINLQCFAIYIPWGPDDGEENFGLSPYDYFYYALSHYKRELAINRDLICPVCSFADYEESIASGRIGAMLTVEDAVILDGRIDRVDEFYDAGVRLMTLTWNRENDLGYPNKTSPERGLKPFGIEALERMNTLGIIADVSHLSDAGFYDVARLSKKPFVASHSCARALCNVGRNLTDDMLKLLGDKGGVAGVNFCTEFLREGAVERDTTYISDIVRHAQYMVNVAGEDAVALGSDFDGISSALEFKDCSGMQSVADALERALGTRVTEKICALNALRVIKECIG